MQLSVRVEGAELVRQGLQDLALEIPRIGRMQIYRVEQRIQKRMKEYPAKRTNQRYDRTFKLKAAWEITRIETGYTLSNRMPYAVYVVGDAYGNRQAWMHVSTDQGKRWSTLRDVTEQEIENLPAEIEKEITLVARRKGL